MSNEIVSQFVGAWSLASWSSVTSGGETLHPMGAKPRGRIIYDAGGRMAVQIGDADRAPLSGAAPDAELRAAFDGYLAYFGAFTVDTERGVVVHHLEMSLNPNWIGVDQVRHFDLEGDRLTLRTPPMVFRGVEQVSTLIWERLV